MAYEELLEGWEAYDNLKKKGGDSLYFYCNEDWEIGYMVNKIKTHYPDLDKTKILIAVKWCCKEIDSPRSREDFIPFVTDKLLDEK